MVGSQPLCIVTAVFPLLATSLDKLHFEPARPFAPAFDPA